MTRHAQGRNTKRDQALQQLDYHNRKIDSAIERKNHLAKLAQSFASMKKRHIANTTPEKQAFTIAKSTATARAKKTPVSLAKFSWDKE